MNSYGNLEVEGTGIGKKSRIFLDDCFNWLSRTEENSIHAIVTDPPYGIKEYEPDQLAKMNSGKGGIWRIPPSFDGNLRSPLPRFTALNARERQNLRDFFIQWARQTQRVLLPGGHIFIASNSFLSQMVFESLVMGGLEFRGEFIRLVRTLRGGDRPKNAEVEFSEVCSMPRGCFEPWGIFRKPLPNKMTVADCLRKHKTGGLRRLPNGNPFNDVVASERTPQREKQIADHPSLKPQSLMRQIVYASLPLGIGKVLDPFMGSGSTIAAAEFHGYQGIGVERSETYYRLAQKAIPKLMSISSGSSYFEDDLTITPRSNRVRDKSNFETSSRSLFE